MTALVKTFILILILLISGLAIFYFLGFINFEMIESNLGSVFSVLGVLFIAALAIWGLSRNSASDRDDKNPPIL
ncbi:MAG: hypothetical protein HOP07_17415 [Bacteriovoracaceae bacterium]|nr:hypothetical protein [Bacteriovoracaceae bacterium]